MAVKRPRYQVLIAKEWYTATTASPKGDGWLHYQLQDGTNGLAKPGTWREKPSKVVNG